MGEKNAEAPSSPATRVTARENTNKMGLFGAVSYIIGNIVGAGLFITPTSVLEQVDSVGLSLTIWVVAALISVLGAFCYVELGTSIRTSGADFAYHCYVKWYPLAFAFMCVGCFVIYPATIAIQAETFSEYLIKGFRIKITSTIHEFYVKKLIGFSLLWLLMSLNFFSLKLIVSRFQIIASLAKVAATAIVICTGFYFLVFKGENENLLHPFEGSTLKPGHIVTALFAGLFSYDGWDVLNFGAEEIEKPKRTMPLSIIIGMSLVAFIFLATNIAFFVVLDTEQMKSSAAVADTFAAMKLGDGQYAVPFLICVLLIGSINSSIFCASRYLHAASRQGHLPTFLSCTNEAHDSPRVAIFVSVLLSLALAFAGNLSQLITYVSFSQWLQRVSTMIALLWIRWSHKPVHPDAIRNPIIVPITFLIVCMALVVTTIAEDVQACIIGLSVLIGGLIIYFLFLYKYSLRKIKGFRIFTNDLNNKVTIYSQIIFNAMPDVCMEETVTVSAINGALDATTGNEFRTTKKNTEVLSNGVTTIIPTAEQPLRNGFLRRKRKATVVDSSQQQQQQQQQQQHQVIQMQTNGISLNL